MSTVVKNIKNYEISIDFPVSSAIIKIQLNQADGLTDRPEKVLDFTSRAWYNEDEPEGRADNRLLS